MATFAINPTGLKVKPTYESMTNYIANQPMIAYPDRTATRIARSQKMALLFNENAAEMAQQQAKAQQNQMMQQMVTGIAQGLVGKGFGKGGTPSSSPGFQTPSSMVNPDALQTPGGSSAGAPSLDSDFVAMSPEPGVPAPPVPTEPIQTDPDIVEGGTQTDHGGLKVLKQKGKGGRNMLERYSDAVMAQAEKDDTGARDVPLTPLQAESMRRAMGKGGSPDFQTPIGRVDEAEGDHTRLPEQIRERTGVHDIATPDPTPRGLDAGASVPGPHSTLGSAAEREETIEEALEQIMEEDAANRESVSRQLAERGLATAAGMTDVVRKVSGRARSAGAELARRGAESARQRAGQAFEAGVSQFQRIMAERKRRSEEEQGEPPRYVATVVEDYSSGAPVQTMMHHAGALEQRALAHSSRPGMFQHTGIAGPSFGPTPGPASGQPLFGQAPQTQGQMPQTMVPPMPIGPASSSQGQMAPPPSSQGQMAPPQTPQRTRRQSAIAPGSSESVRRERAARELARLQQMQKDYSRVPEMPQEAPPAPAPAQPKKRGRPPRHHPTELELIHNRRGEQMLNQGPRGSAQLPTHEKRGGRK